MNAQKLQDAIELIGDDLLAEARAPRIPWKRITAAAAAIALICVAGIILRSPTPTPSPATPTTSDIVTPAVKPNNSITLQNKVEATGLHYGFTGNADKTSTSGVSAEPVTIGVSATVKAVEYLPDTYQLIGQGDYQYKRYYRVYKMQTLNPIYGQNLPEEFYYLIPDYVAVDLTDYDALVIVDMAHWGFENSIMYNLANDTYEVFEHPLLGSYNYGPEHLMFYQDGIAVPSPQPVWEALENSETLEDAENAVLKHHENNSRPSSPTVAYLSEVTSAEVLEALDYVSPFRNGIFIPGISLSRLHHGPPIQVTYRRYLNGYPTNETVHISGETVTYSNATFTNINEDTLPDLASALLAINQQFNSGTITPPHIENWKELEQIAYSIQGWYSQTDTGVYGIIKIAWRFDGGRAPDYLDDAYYIIEAGSNEVYPIGQSDLLELVPTSRDFIFQGEYNESGMIYKSISAW